MLTAVPFLNVRGVFKFKFDLHARSIWAPSIVQLSLAAVQSVELL